MVAAFVSMLETPGVEFEHDATVEEALYLLDQFPSADFADCLLLARATHLGRSRFVTYDAGAARLPRGELLHQGMAACRRQDGRRDANGLEPVASSSRQGLIWWREMLEFCRARQRVRPSDRSSSVLAYDHDVPLEWRGT
jgi:hypothetical protein